MNKSSAARKPKPVVKLGTSRQVVIPKRIHDQLGLEAGDFLEVGVDRGKVVFTPQALIERRLAEGLADLNEGRVSPKLSSSAELSRSLARRKKN